MKTMETRLARLALAALLAAAGACNGHEVTDPNASGVLDLALSAHQAPADGATVVQVTGTVDRDTRGDARKLIFTTGAGAFTDGGEKTVTVAVDENGVATVGLRAPTDSGVVRVRVSAGAAERVDSVLFTRAAPEQVLVEPEKFAVSAGLLHEIRVTAQLRRGLGVVTPGTAVAFRAFKEGTQEEIGQFGVATLSDTAGVVTVRYTPGNTVYRGRVRIVGTAAGTNVTGEAVIEITD
jgi:hypothetical protein